MTAERGVVQSLDRAMTLLALIADARDGLRLGELAAAAGLPASTCHRLLATMEQRRFVQFDAPASAWLVGRQAFRVGAAFVRRAAFVAPALPAMRALRDATRETINIGAPDDGSVVILAQVESREVVRAINVVGGESPLSSSGLGKAILSTWSDDAVARHIERHGLPRSTANSLVEASELRDDLATIRARGYAIDCEEHLLGLHCVAAPVFGASGDAVAALSASGLAARMYEGRMKEIGAQVVAAAATLSEAGAVAPASVSA